MELIFSEDVMRLMQLASQQIRPLLRAAYQNNQITSLIFHDVTYTGTVDYLTDSTVYLGLTAGRSRQIPLTQITQVNLHQSQPWWHLYEQNAK